MNMKLLTLAGRIRGELSDIYRVVKRVPEAWQRAQQSNDDYYLDSVALNLHTFYSGLERIFELIASRVDESKPQGDHWHQDLLRQMAIEIPRVRPRVISPETRDRLEAYRGFRHVVRNVYTFNLNPLRIEPLVAELPATFASVESDIARFLQFLEAEGTSTTQ